jgi:nucleoid-associated protein YgaU
LMEIDPTSKPPMPPTCQFDWANFKSFPVFIVKVSLNFDLFSPEGKPLRAYADIQFKQATDDGKLVRQNPTSGSYARKIWTVLEGETLDWIAYQEYGDANAWRHIAEINGLNDPMNLRPGQLLKLTPLE